MTGPFGPGHSSTNIWWWTTSPATRASSTSTQETRPSFTKSFQFSYYWQSQLYQLYSVDHHLLLRPPSFVFETAQPPYTHQRFTPQHSIPYFLNPSDVSSWSNSKLRQLDQKAEITFVRGLRDQCQNEFDTRQQKLADAQGWWGQVKDQEAWDAARTMRLGSCDRLRGMGYRPEVY